MNKKHVNWLATLMLVVFGHEAVADGSWAIDSESFGYVSAPFNEAMFADFEREIDSGKFSHQWSNTEAKVKWTPNCTVSLEIATALPFFPDTLDLSDGERERMDRAVELLKKHERRQADLWRLFAEEIKRRGCPSDSASINAYWQEKVSDHNVTTNFGFDEGFSKLNELLRKN